jgi:Ca2+-binding RTX toxin-like protein
MYGSLSGNDTLVGGTGADTLEVVTGSTGSSLLESGSGVGGGNQLYSFGTGDNTLEGAQGNDSLYAHDSGSDTLYSGTGSGSDFIELLYSTGNDSVSVANGGNNTVYLGSGNDTLDASGATGNNFIDTWTGNSTINLGSGDDSVNVLYPTGGSSGMTDSITAGAGQDNIYFIGLSQEQASISQSFAGGIETTTVQFGGQTVDVTASSVAGSNVDLWFTDAKVNGG